MSDHGTRGTWWRHSLDGALSALIMVGIYPLLTRSNTPFWLIILVAVGIGAAAGLVSLLFARRRGEQLH